MLRSFKPIIKEDSKILILGSMPGEESLRKNEYYGNPRNQFWRIFYSLMALNHQDEYEKRCADLLKHHWALWDAIEACERSGSLDSKIKETVPNNFENLYKVYPNLRVVGFNGAKAYEVYRRQVGLNLKENLIYYTLPSTSPANTMPFEKKLEHWRVLLDA